MAEGIRSYCWNLEPSAKRRAHRLTAIFAFLILLSTGILLFNLLGFSIVFQSLVNAQVVLTNGTLSFEQWLLPSPRIYKVVTVYNITNTDEVSAGQAPVVQPLGPYYFREYREKVNVGVVYNQEIWFSENKHYVFDDEKTNANLSSSTKLDPATDTFTTINLAYVGIAYNLTTINAPVSEIIEAFAAAEVEGEMSLFMKNRTVKEIMFGYKDPLLTIIKLKFPTLPDTIQIVYNMSRRDMTKRSKIWNGQKDVSLLGQYTEWQGFTSLPWWGSKEANTINGTEGLFFAPNVDRDASLTTWTDDLFRSNPMEYVCDEIVHKMNTYKFGIPEYVLANATRNPLNAGFYSFCPSGLMNLTSVVNAPVFASKPSFLDGESWLLDEVVGLPPANRTTMDTNIWVEPITGALVNAKKQLQVNMLIERMEKFPKLGKLRKKPRYVPIALVVETGGMDDELAGTFRTEVFLPRLVFIIVVWCLYGIANVSLVGVGITLHKHLKKNQSTDRTLLIPAEDKAHAYGADNA